MVAIVFPNSTSEERNQATLRVLTNYFTNYLKTFRIMAIKVIAQRREVKIGKNPGKKFVMRPDLYTPIENPC